MTLGLQIDVEEIENRVVLRIDGRIDAASAPFLERKIESLIAEEKYYLLLDFVRVDYLSSAGMRVLLAESKKLKSKNGYMMLFSIGEEVAEIIRMAGFDKILQIYSNQREALQAHSKQ